MIQLLEWFRVNFFTYFDNVGTVQLKITSVSDILDFLSCKISMNTWISSVPKKSWLNTSTYVGLFAQSISSITILGEMGPFYTTIDSCFIEPINIVGPLRDHQGGSRLHVCVQWNPVYSSLQRTELRAFTTEFGIFVVAICFLPLGWRINRIFHCI